MARDGQFPGKESEKNTYYNLSVPHLVDNMVRLNVSAESTALIAKGLDDWNNWYQKSLNLNLRSKSIVANKDAAMHALETNLKRVYGDIPQSALTHDDRTILNLLERSTSRTPAAVPTTAPVGQLNGNVRLEHTISFTDEDGKHGKPEGVRGCQIWCKQGEPVLSVKELLFLATDTASPYLNKFDVSDVGKTIHYWLRWENSRGETGPWSTVISGTVAG